MEELVGRLTALDPDASAGLKVISYFDSLVDGHASIEAFLRGAAILTGCASGLDIPGQRLRMRVDEKGARAEPPKEGEADRWLQLRLGYGDEGGDGVVWVERRGAEHANDQIVLERLAWGLRLTIERREGRMPVDASAGVESLLDARTAPGERLRVASRLHIGEQDPVRAVALPPDTAVTSGRVLSAIMPSRAGMLRAVIETRSPRHDTPIAAARRAGVGPWGDVTTLHESWERAVVALRLSAASAPVVHADELGSVAMLASVVDAQDAPLDEVSLIDGVAGLSPWALASLEAFAEHDSVRAAATALGIHHSTAQSRCEQLESALGYTLRTQAGRTRLYLALRLQRLTHARFS